MSRGRIALAALAALASLGATDHLVSRHRASTSLDGVWEYINPGMSGQAFMTDGRYVYFSRETGGAQNDPAHTEFTVHSGTFTVTDTIATARHEYSSDPREVGQAWRWSYSMKGDTCTYHVLDAAGQAVYTGRAVRRRPAPGA